MPIQTSPGAEGGLPSHPPPVRAGLIPNSVAAQASNKPMPIRNYNNVTPGQQPPNTQAAGPKAALKTPEAPPVTVEELERLRNSVKINPNDQNTQMLLAKKLVEASEVLAPQIPDQRARNKAREKYVMDASKLLKKLVQGQNMEATFYLADCYGRGALGFETDNKEAFSLYQSAAKAGHAAAAYRTAVCCELGNEEGGGTRKDPLKAIQWYKRAAMLGDTPAMYKMGMIQLKGLLGQPKNPREAVGWLKRAAERADAENPHALHELGLLYEQPQGTDNSVVRDEAYSFSLFNQAGELGYKFSQFRLGCAYEYGLFGCQIDPRQSIMWYSRAAAQEEHQSELALSGWYLTGSEGVLQQSDTEAYLWARKAAMAGLAKAEYAMGYFTEVGIGAPANLEDAKRWYWRAAGMSFPSPLPH
jgi:TPR repeat protein